MTARALMAVTGLLPAAAIAHPAGVSGSVDTGTAAVLSVLLGVVMLYAGGLARLGPRAARTLAGSAACMAGGAIVLAACLLPPLDTWSATWFSAHMAQHELLMLVATPLLVLGRPLPVLLWAFPHGVRQRIAAGVRQRPLRAAWRALLHPAAGWTAHALALWLWHVPLLFRAALEDPLLHELQHGSFVVAAMLFWHGLFRARSAASRGAAVFYLFTTTVHTAVLGALITFAGTPLYAPDVRSAGPLDALADQQLGGLIMWVPGSMVYVAAGLVLFLQWVRGPQGWRDGDLARGAT